MTATRSFPTFVGLSVYGLVPSDFQVFVPPYLYAAISLYLCSFDLLLVSPSLLPSPLSPFLFPSHHLFIPLLFAFSAFRFASLCVSVLYSFLPSVTSSVLCHSLLCFLTPCCCVLSPFHPSISPFLRLSARVLVKNS